MSDRRSPDRLAVWEAGVRFCRGERRTGVGGVKFPSYWMRIYAAPRGAEAEAGAGEKKKLGDGRSKSARVLPLDASSANRRDSSRWREGRAGGVSKAAGFRITIAPPWAARPVSPLHISTRLLFGWPYPREKMMWFVSLFALPGLYGLWAFLVWL